MPKSNLNARSLITFLGVEPWEARFFKQHLPGRNLLFASTEKPKPDFFKKTRPTVVLSTFIGTRVDARLLASLPNLRFVATRSTGFDHLDLTELKKQKITASNVPSYGENTVAEHTFGLILNLSRKIHHAYQRTVLGDFSRAGLRGFDLKGKTIGVVGVGRIGQHVIRIARGFDMNVVAYDKFPKPGLVRELGFKYVTLDALLRQSDVITLHAPSTPATRHLINRQNIRRCKRGSLLINTARGDLVETAALVQALNQGWLGGAGLDVLEEESRLVTEEAELLSPNVSDQTLRLMLGNQLLLRRANVIITPHNAFNSHEAIERILQTTVENILAFTKGAPINLVTG